MNPFEKDQTHPLLLAASIAAAAVIGFFLALVWQSGQNSAQFSGTAPQQITPEQKAQALDNLNPATASSTEEGASSIGSSVSASQADVNDQEAAAKLKLVDSLNASR